MAQHPVSLFDLLSNSLILRQTAPYLAARDLCRLSASSKDLRNLLISSHDGWRHLDLTTVKRCAIEAAPIDVGGISWRAERMDEALTEDDFYSGPLRGVLSNLHRRSILRFVQTLVLDSLSVPADLVREIISEEGYNVRVLSIRDAAHLNLNKLNQVLRYVCRPTRAEGTPKLKALYVFGSEHATTVSATLSGYQSFGVMDGPGAKLGSDRNQLAESTIARDERVPEEESAWYNNSGRVLRRPFSDWADTLQVCKGIIQFDATLCRGPRHNITKVDSKDFLQPAIATIALGPKGCESCHSCPEGPAVFGECNDGELPLIGPPPLHSSTAHAASRPTRRDDGRFPRFIARCQDCLFDRWCEMCRRWWCEDCYQKPVPGASPGPAGLAPQSAKVYARLCVDDCLVREMMDGAGSNGMWG